MKKVKVTYVAKKEVIIDLENYSEDATIEEILDIEKTNTENYGIEFETEEINTEVEFC